MKKNFTDWMEIKQRIQNSYERPHDYTQGEVWWVSIGKNVGFEEDGKGREFNRPVLILKGFSKDLFWGIPLSTTKKRGKYYYEFSLKDRVSVALLSQLRTFDTLRLLNKVGVIRSGDLNAIKSKLHEILA